MKKRLHLASTEGGARSKVRHRLKRPSRERVLNAALRLVDDCGITAVTIRAVAKAVNAAPMTLYVHFKSKDELLDLLAGEAARRLCQDAGHETWQAELTALCHQVRNVVAEHPHWAHLLSRPAAATQMRPSQRLLTLMADSGLRESYARTVVTSSCVMLLALCVAELTLRDRDGASIFAAAIDGGFPLTVRAFVAGLAVQPLEIQ